MSLVPIAMMRYFAPGCAQDVAVEAGEGAGTGDVVQETSAADAFVEHADVGGCLLDLEARCEYVGPARVFVGC